MAVMVQPPLTEGQIFLFVVQVWGFFQMSRQSQPHAVIALFKNHPCGRCQGSYGFLSWFGRKKLEGVSSVLALNLCIYQTVVKHLRFHLNCRNVRFSEDYRMGRCLLHEEVLVYLNIPNLHSDIWAYTMELLYGMGCHAYLPPMLGFDWSFPLLVEVHEH